MFSQMFFAILFLGIAYGGVIPPKIMQTADGPSGSVGVDEMGETNNPKFSNILDVLDSSILANLSAERCFKGQEAGFSWGFLQEGDKKAWTMALLAQHKLEYEKCKANMKKAEEEMKKAIQAKRDGEEIEFSDDIGPALEYLENCIRPMICLMEAAQTGEYPDLVEKAKETMKNDLMRMQAAGIDFMKEML